MKSHAKAPSAGSTQRQATGLGRTGIAFACLFALLAFCGIGASTALAGQTRLPVPGVSPLAEPEAITDPNGIAINEESGNVFVNDAGTHTEILGANGGPPAGLISPYLATSGCSFGTSSNGNGVAVDNSATSSAKGTLYVVCRNGKIRRFTRDPVTEKYVAGSEISYPGSAIDAGATVDADGNLFVSNFNPRAVYKFDPSGSLIKTIVLSEPAASIAVDSTGSLFYRRAGGGEIFKCPADLLGEISPSTCTKFVTLTGAPAVAVDRNTDTLYIALGNRVVQYDAISLTKEFEFGQGVLTTTRGIAVNSTTDRVYVSDTGTGKDHIAVFGPQVPIPDATTKAASGVSGTRATLNGVVNPQGVEVTDCEFEYGLTTTYGNTAPCEGSIPTDSSDHTVSAVIAGLEPNGATYHFRLVVNSPNGGVKGADRTLVTGGTVFTEPATEVEGTTATLNGIVRPEGEQVTECKFEYGTALDYGQSVPCSPSAGAIPDDFDPHAVTGALSGLEPNTTYHFRLRMANSFGATLGEDRSFTTFGPPRIVEQQPLNATQTAVTLQARIDPSGSPTTYHFEFGTDTSYGTRIPADHELFAGSGTDPVAVSANRSGLQESSVYFFRVVATNSRGTAVGPDQRFETLNEHGLPNSRAFELVTPADKGPAGSVADSASPQRRTQVSPDGESLMYPFMNGDEASTAGGWLRYRAERIGEGWLSAQISGPSLVPPPRSDSVGIAMPSLLHWVSPDNSCAILESYNPLSEDTPPASVELGVTNLYRWSAADRDYDLLTHMPLNPELNAFSELYYSKIDASDDCSRVYFKSLYDFLPGTDSGLYESEEGTLRDAGVLQPDGSVVGASAVLGGNVGTGEFTGRWNAVSPDGSRVFFTAKEGPSSDPAVFMRTDGGDDVVEISASQTAVPANGARFEAASPDGSRIFFRANYGIADTASAGPSNGACGPFSGETEFNPTPKIEQKPCDLYAYDIETGRLTDLSIEATAPGAQIQGTIAVDEDGSHVYFAALGQLTPGKGRTYAENTAGFGSANVYLARLDETGELSDLSYVTTLAEHGLLPVLDDSENGKFSTGDLLGVSGSGGTTLMRRSNGWNANISSDGKELLFVSSLNLTGWESGDVYKYAAYLYAADTGRLTCVSCRPDGLPSVALPAREEVSISFKTDEVAQAAWLLAPQGIRGRSLSEDGSRVVFTSPDVLALGAVEGKRNVYLWQEGQVFFLAGAEPGGVGGLGEYQGMSSSGDDIFIATNEQRVPQDRDSLSDVYDVRVDGGFPVVPEPPNCQVDEAIPLIPNQTYCQGDQAPQPPSSGVASASFSGPGNPPQADGKPRPRACRKGQVRRRGKCVKRPKRGAKRKRATNHNRGGVK